MNKWRLFGCALSILFRRIKEVLQRKWGAIHALVVYQQRALDNQSWVRPIKGWTPRVSQAREYVAQGFNHAHQALTVASSIAKTKPQILNQGAKK